MHVANNQGQTHNLMKFAQTVLSRKINLFVGNELRVYQNLINSFHINRHFTIFIFATRNFLEKHADEVVVWQVNTNICIYLENYPKIFYKPK